MTQLTALVTGSSRGIGAAIARAFARDGARVTVVARTAGPLEAVAQEIGGRAVVADLFDATQVDGLIDRVEREIGPIDVLVNNAGMETTKSIFDATRTDVDELLTLNLHVPIHLSRAALARMRDRGRGHIVNISSMAANGGFGGMSVDLLEALT